MAERRSTDIDPQIYRGFHMELHRLVRRPHGREMSLDEAPGDLVDMLPGDKTRLSDYERVGRHREFQDQIDTGAVRTSIRVSDELPPHPTMGSFTGNMNLHASMPEANRGELHVRVNAVTTPDGRHRVSVNSRDSVPDPDPRVTSAFRAYSRRLGVSLPDHLQRDRLLTNAGVKRLTTALSRIG